jgi:hypothetical protein
MAPLQRTKQPGDMVTSRQIRGAILPWEKQLIDTLGLTIEEYNWYANEVANYRPERDPAYDHVPDVVCIPVVPLVMTIVGMGISFAASAMAPKPKLPRQTDPAQQQQEQRGADVSGASVSGSNRFTNVDGFTSVQPLARLGESMQLVFANRRNNYGGVRVETKLLWSQLLSQGDGQELLAIFLANGGELASQPDFDGMGIGDSLLRGYQSSKLAMYFRNGNSTNRISLADKKGGDLTPRNNSDVFLAELKTNNNMQPIFSGVRIPSTMTTFGISEPLRNAQGFKLPYKRVREVYPPQPIFQFNLDLWARDQADYNRKYATVREAAYEKYKIESLYASRTGIMRVEGKAEPGNQRHLDLDVSVNDIIQFQVFGGNVDAVFGEFGNTDIHAKENNYRQSVDDTIIVGETYLVAGAEAVCISESSNDLWTTNNPKLFKFKVLDVGVTRIVNEGLALHGADFRQTNLGSFNNPAYGPTLTKLTIAHFTTTRKLNQVEIGIKSQVYKRFTGMSNFASIPNDSTLTRIEEGGNNFNVGTYSEYGLRYSFFRLEIKEKGGTGYVRLVNQPGGVFAVKGRTPVSQFNFIRVAFPSLEKQYEIRFRPISGGQYLEVQFKSGNPLCVLDSRTGSAQEYTVQDSILGSFQVSFKGYLERITQGTATNEVMFYGGKPIQGLVTGFAPISYSANNALSATTFATTGGSGSGLTVRVESFPKPDFSPSGTVVTGMSTRWLHMGIMGAPEPSYEGQTYTADVQFNYATLDPASGGNVNHFVIVRLTLRATSLATYGYFGSGYGIRIANGYPYDDDEGWGKPLLWVNQNLASSRVTIISDSSNYNESSDARFIPPSDMPNGEYTISKPNGFAAPYNGTILTRIYVTYAASTTYIAGLSIANGGAGYKVNDRITVVSSTINTPQIIINDVASPDIVQRIEEPFDAIADVYMNDGQEGSHDAGPEHQIVYVNEQRQNFLTFNDNTVSYAPKYEEMTLLGLQLRSGKEWSSFNNFTYYAKQGCKIRKIINDANGNTYDVTSTAVEAASNLYPEILYHLVATSSLMPTTMIDWDGFAEGCKVCLANNFYWDGVLSAPVNIRDWGHENAQYFFLDFMVLGGKLSLQPTFPVVKGSGLSGYTLAGAYNRKPVISALFTDGNIIEDSLSVNWYPAEQRKAPQILVTLRDEVENGFAETRNILVSRVGTENPQVEAIDFTGFCTSADHAIQFAKLLINMRYHITHVISFKTLPNGLALQPGQYFRVSSQARHVEQFQNGYVLEDGTVVSSSPMAAGTYTVYFWRSSMTQVEERSMVIGATGKTTPEFANSVFTQYSSSTSNRLYKAEQIAYDEEGMVEITGSHVPLMPDDGRITYLNMDDALFTVQNEQ